MPDDHQESEHLTLDWGASQVEGRVAQGGAEPRTERVSGQLASLQPALLLVAAPRRTSTVHETQGRGAWSPHGEWDKCVKV